MATEGQSRPKLGDVLPQTIGDWQNEYAKMKRQRDELKAALADVKVIADEALTANFSDTSVYQPAIGRWRNLVTIVNAALNGVAQS